MGFMLAIGSLHGHDTIVLGAWGCSASGNDANEIAGLFERSCGLILKAPTGGEYLQLSTGQRKKDSSVRSNGSFQTDHKRESRKIRKSSRKSLMPSALKKSRL